MASFDIQDLYTNVPLVETIDICLNKLNDGSGSIYNLPTNYFRKMLELSVFNSIFMFNSKYYKQIDGLGMGLPLSPTLANIFLCHHEEEWLRNCPENFRPIFFKRYMDDTIALFREKAHISKFLIYLNARHQNLKFTCEIEENRKLPFLDCMLERRDNDFISTVYRKPTFTGQGLHYLSYAIRLFKINSIRTLVHRAYCVSSSMTGFHKELFFLVNYFFDNGYPRSLVYREIRKFLYNIMNPTPKIPTVEKYKMFISMPYFGPHSDKLVSEIEKIMGKFFPQIDIKIILVNKNTIGSFFSFKDVLPTLQRSSVIYKYCCDRCPATSYLGSTSRPLYMRIAEHRGRSIANDNLLGNPKYSAIREHGVRSSHRICPDNFSIVGTAKNEISLRILESLMIARDKPNLNKTLTSFPLNIAL